MHATRKAFVARVVAITSLSVYTIVALAHDAYRALTVAGVRVICLAINFLVARSVGRKSDVTTTCSRRKKIAAQACA